MSKEFNQLYSFTTENLEYMRVLDFKDKTVVSVGGSYDQAINAYMLGARSVTNIDINPIAIHYAHLKHCALKNLDYCEFKDFFLRHPQSLNFSIYQSLSHLLMPQSKLFFDMHYARFGNQLRESIIFNNLFDEPCHKIYNTVYLRDKAFYLMAQENLKSFIWKTQSIVREILASDVVLLSNLSDYAHYMFDDSLKFREKIIQPWFDKLNPGGKIMTAYIYDSYNQQKNTMNEIENRQKMHEGAYFEIHVPTALIGVNAVDSACVWEKI